MPQRKHPPLRAVFFDLLDTLARFVPSQEALLVEACREFGLEISEADARRGFLVAGDYYRRSVASQPLVRRPPDRQAAFFAEYDRRALTTAGLDVGRDLAYRVFARMLERSQREKARLRLFEDAAPALAALKDRGLTLGLISNWGPDLAEVCRDLGLTTWLEVVVDPSTALAAKPDPAIFRAALRAAEVLPEEALYVGDNPAIDVAGARRAGLRPVLLDRFEVFPDFNRCPRATSLLELSEFV